MLDRRESDLLDGGDRSVRGPWRERATGTVMLALAAGGYQLGRARADGIPTAPSMYFGATIEEAGVPVTAMRTLRVRLWDLASGGTLQCDSGSVDVMVTAGRARVGLPAECTTAVQRSPEQWVELSVNGVVAGARSRLGAVPYAVEAQRASALTEAAQTGLVPPGAVLAFGGSAASPPAGWLSCDGRAVSRTEYARLFAAIGIAHGAGDGIATFNLPDYRGRFLRGVDMGSGRDPDRASRGAANAGGADGDSVGSVQGDAFRRHAHGVSDPGHRHDVSAAASGSDTANAVQVNQRPGGYLGATSAARTATTGVVVLEQGGNETRPINAGVIYLIRY